ncbi:hypothetical protein M6B38_117185 [Iris pallida]|uniref:Uncharacterized protein n=1 Tax=Iris pallida TaxID=29817 RepID=A0AAX6HU88_IRIPA|nr:hypothetical protein M6B38_117185 [Iris pallida]
MDARLCRSRPHHGGPDLDHSNGLRRRSARAPCPGWTRRVKKKEMASWEGRLQSQRTTVTARQLRAQRRRRRSPRLGLVFIVSGLCLVMESDGSIHIQYCVGHRNGPNVLCNYVQEIRTRELC